MQGSGCRIHGLGLRIQGVGFRAQGSGFRVWDLEFRVQGSGCRVQGAGLRGYIPATQCVGQHILLDVQGAVLALVVRQSNTNLSL